MAPNPPTADTAGPASSWRQRLTQRLQPEEAESVDAEASGQLGELSRQWRRHISSHTTGLRPLLDSSRDHVRGSDDAAITLMEYGDYEAPSCREAAPVLRALGTRFGDELRFAFRHFPIADAHPRALSVAVAAEAAGAQGQFWGMHDRIFGSEFGIEPGALRRLAKELDLDLDRYDADIAGGAHVAHVFEDFNSGTLSGVNGTPTFFINGARLDWDFQPGTLGDALQRVLPAESEPVGAVGG
jgi:protein-disulfide isomerase